MIHYYSHFYFVYVFAVIQNDKAKYSHYNIKRENGTPTYNHA